MRIVSFCLCRAKGCIFAASIVADAATSRPGCNFSISASSFPSLHEYSGVSRPGKILLLHFLERWPDMHDFLTSMSDDKLLAAILLLV